MSLYIYFLLYLGLGLTLSGVLFAWAVRSGQFAGQNRASWFPLEGEQPLAEPCPWAGRWPASFYGTLSIVALSAVLFGAVIILLVLRT